VKKKLEGSLRTRDHAILEETLLYISILIVVPEVARHAAIVSRDSQRSLQRFNNEQCILNCR
jgi:hypothetical protein